MLPDFNEGQRNINPDNPGQESKDPRIPNVIEALTQSARELREMTNRKEGSEDPMASPNLHPQISYATPDELNYVRLDSRDFDREDYALHNLPKPIKDHERIIPVWVEWVGRRGIDSWSGVLDTHVWISLDEDIPKVFQLVNEYRETVKGASLTGKEQVIERQDLLPDIVETVSAQRKSLFWA